MRRLLMFLTLFAAVPLIAQEPVTLDRMQHPGLLLRTSTPGVFLSAPSVRTEISLQVRGIVARGLVRQTFENATGRCVEAVYVFPLSEQATVDALRMKVGARTITGEIKEREEAARVYEQAKQSGQRASLLEQQRPNLFTVSVASIAAGETTEIEIEYQEIVRYDNRFSLRVPLAIGPRYAPPGSDPALPAMRQEPAHPRRNPVTLTIDLDAGIALDLVKSPTHQLESTQLSGTRVQLKPKDVHIASDRDFELVWTPRLGALPQSTSFSEVAGGQRYTLLMLFPPDVSQRPAAVLPRETTFVIDTSGSMAGQSLEQAKQALLTAIERLRPSDHFNVIEFNSFAQPLFEKSRPADRSAIEEALQWVRARQSTGGTEMLSALQLALGQAPQTDAIRQIIFITDGQVGNEPEVFAYIREHLGDARLFTIGIGHAPNSYFMRTAARTGRGTFTHIGDTASVEEKMTELFQKLESPVLSNIAIQAEGEMWPKETPDLYAGEPLVLTLRAPANAAAKGRVTAHGWQSAFTATAGESHSGIAKLWARQKIDAVRDRVFTGAKPEEVRGEIVQLALAHHLVTEHTSLVAVDTTPAGVDPQACKSELVPVNLPAGWGGIEGALPRSSTHATLSILLGCLALALAVVVLRR